MQLTNEQQELLQQAKASEQGRVMMRFTEAQKKEWREAVQQELAGKDENIAHIRKIRAAAEKPGFFGDIRRAIALARRPLAEIAVEIGVDPRLLSDFRAAEAELPAAALDGLVEALGLRLMQEIPR